MLRIHLLLVTCLLAALALPAPAAAQVQRCVDAQGNSIYTDRPCSSMNAAPRQAPAPASGAYASGFGRQGCARTSRQLLDGVRDALDARDVNRLANFYHWPGTGRGSAKHLMDALEAVASRPLVAATLVVPEPITDPAWPDPETGELPVPAENAPRPRPTGLRVEQMAGPGDASSRSTQFALRQHAGCWWIEL